MEDERHFCPIIYKTCYDLEQQKNCSECKEHKEFVEEVTIIEDIWKSLGDPDRSEQYTVDSFVIFGTYLKVSITGNATYIGHVRVDPRDAKKALELIKCLKEESSNEVNINE